MFFAQDIQINDFQNFQETAQVCRISYERQNSAVIETDNSSTAIYKHELKKPKIEAPQTKVISPVAKAYAHRLKYGDSQERAFVINTINSVCQQNIKEAAVFSDEDITNALFEIIQEDISKLSKPTKRQIRLRKEFNENKKLSQKQKEIALKYSEYEIAEHNKMLAFYTIGTIQNLTYKVIVKKTGIHPDFYDSSVNERIINEAKNNKDENMRAAAIGTLHMIAKPEYNKDLKPIFQSALSDKSETVRDIAKESLEYIE